MDESAHDRVLYNVLEIAKAGADKAYKFLYKNKSYLFISQTISMEKFKKYLKFEFIYSIMH